MGTNEKTATTEAQKTTEARNIKTLEVGISLDPWSVVKLTKVIRYSILQGWLKRIDPIHTPGV